MSRELRMPSLGADMEDGVLVEWRTKPGATIRRGEVLALVETAKGIIDVESFEEGQVEKLLVKPGERIPVGAPMALLAGDAVSTAASAAPAAQPAAPAAPAATPATVPAPSRRPHISPAARQRAAAAGIDIATLRGSGPDGAVTLADVEAASTRDRSAPRAAMRATIGAALGRSKREIPHYYLQHEVDFGPARQWLEQYNAARPVPERLLPTVLLIRAVARAADEIKGFSGYFRDNAFEAAATVHVGVAVSTRGAGLMAPAILDAGSKPVAQLMTELQQMVGRVRQGHLRSSELSAGTITLTSLGDDGVDALWPIIYPPQVAIVGFGAPRDKPWALDGRIAVRPVMTVTLAADHRVTDGRLGARFLARIAALLMHPEE